MSVRYSFCKQTNKNHPPSSPYMTQKIRQIWFSCKGRRPWYKETKGVAENQRNAWLCIAEIRKPGFRDKNSYVHLCIHPQDTLSHATRLQYVCLISFSYSCIISRLYIFLPYFIFVQFFTYLMYFCTYFCLTLFLNLFYFMSIIFFILLFCLFLFLPYFSVCTYFCLILFWCFCQVSKVTYGNMSSW